MKTNFNPILYRNPLIGAAIQGGVGLLQSILGGGRARRAQKQLENLQSPTYNPNQGIMDYYNKALERYGVNPQDSALYKAQTRNANRGLATGLSVLRDKRSTLGGISGLVSGYNDSMLNTEVAAEQEKSRRFGQLGSATGMKAGEEKTAFDINQMQPFERKYNLLAMKAGGGAQTANAGLQNIFGAGNTLSQMAMIKSMYGDGESISGNGSSGYNYQNSPYWKRRTGQ